VGAADVQQEVEAVVRYPALVAGVEQDVARLEVAVDDRLLQPCVQVIQPLGDAECELADYVPPLRVGDSLCVSWQQTRSA
jgi:hypothetical protein